MALAYLLDPAFEIVNTAGKPCTGGWIECYVHGTRDKYYCASDFDGTLHPFKIPLDSLGSNVVLADNSLSYDVYIYNRYGGLLMSRYNVIPSAGSGGGGGSDEYLEWMECEPMSITDGSNVPGVSEGTMTSDSDGLLVYEGHHYHITNSFTVVPTGDGISYDTFTVALMFDDDNGPVTLVSRSWDVDNSLTDSNEFEFSYDLVPSADGRVYWAVTGASSFSSVTGMMQVHRIYSGIAALPDTYARKDWVEEQISSSINYSALEYNPYGEVTGISGSAIAGGLDSATVSAIASSYAESAVSSKVDQSAFDDCCSAMSGYVSALQTDVSSISASVSAVTGNTGNYIDWSASGTFQPSGNYMSSSDMSSYVPFSGLETDNGKITSISGTALGGHEYSGIWPVIVDNTADTIAVLNKSLCVDETMTGYESAGSAVIGVNTGTVLSGLTAYQTVADMTGYQPVGDYAFNSSVSAKLDASASSDFYSTSNPSGFITGVDLSDYQPTSAMTAYQSAGDYAYNSAVSGKLDASASSDFYSTSNPSGFITGVDLSNYATTGYVDSSVSSKLDATASADFYSTSNPSGFITGVDLSDYQPVSGMTAYQLSGDYYSATNPSGFITGVDLTDYATTAYVDSSVSSKLDASASSDFYSTSNPSGFITGVDLSNYATTGYVDSSVSGKQDISGMTAYQPVGTYIYESALGWAEV